MNCGESGVRKNYLDYCVFTLKKKLEKNKTRAPEIEPQTQKMWNYIYGAKPLDQKFG